MGSRHYRAHQRYPVVLDASLTAGQRGATVRGTLVDLGLGGAAFEVDGPLRIGDPVQVELHTTDSHEGEAEPGSGSVTISGRVAWVAWGESSAVRLGVSFDEYAFDAVIRILDVHASGEGVGT